MNRLIQPTRHLGFTQLYLDFLAGKNSARNFYSGNSLEQIGSRLDSSPIDRDKIIAILLRQSELYGSSLKAQSNIEKLRDPGAVCICAGQQAGLLGGPMFSVVKGLAVSKAAGQLSERLGRPVIPVFWIAADDHDFAEVNHTHVLDRNGDLCRIEYTTAPDRELPIGRVYLNNTEELAASITKLRECLGETDFSGPLYEMLGRSYRPGETFVNAFGKLMAALTADYGLVLFSPVDTEAKKLGVPLFEAILRRQSSLHDATLARNQSIQRAGYHLQVQKHEQATHLFLNLDGRKPIYRAGDRFTVAEKSFTLDNLLSLLHNEPERFSPDVLTRPLFQSTLFPVAAQMGGPSEIAYFAQGNALFELFDLPLPQHLARPTVILLERRFDKLISEFNITFQEISGDVEQLVNRVMAAGFPPDLQRNYEGVRSDIKARFDQFGNESLAFDQSLKEFSKQTFGKIDFALKNFEEKLFASHKRKSKEIRERIYRLRTAVYPHSAMQDRSLNISYFIAKHGTGIIPFLFERLNPFDPAPVVAPLSEMDA